MGREPQQCRRDAGFRIVFGTSVLRSIAVIVFSITLFAIVPEGLAAAWVADYTGERDPNGLYLAVIMAASPLGLVLGSLTMARLVRPTLRTRLVRPFAILSPWSRARSRTASVRHRAARAISGFAVAGLMPVANGLFVQALPHGYGPGLRRHGTGVQLCRECGAAHRAVAQKFEIPGGRPVERRGRDLIVVVSATWPSPRRFEDAIAQRGDPAGAHRPPGGPAQRGAPTARGAPASAALQRARPAASAGTPPSPAAATAAQCAPEPRRALAGWSVSRQPTPARADTFYEAIAASRRSGSSSRSSTPVCRRPNPAAIYPEEDLGPATERLTFSHPVLGARPPTPRSAATPVCGAARAVPGRSGGARRLALHSGARSTRLDLPEEPPPRCGAISSAPPIHGQHNDEPASVIRPNPA